LLRENGIQRRIFQNQPSDCKNQQKKNNENMELELWGNFLKMAM
jgi:hypothetical protein